MKKRCAMLAVVGVLLCCAPGRALDAVRTTSGVSVSGRIVEITPLKVVVEQIGVQKEIPTSEIAGISYDAEPALLKAVRSNALAGRYEEALAALDKLEVKEGTRKEIVQEIQFYKALCTARLALAGNAAIADAGRMMIAFVKAYPGSYHTLEASEVIGDLLVANRSYAQAESYYAKLAETPWPNYKMRAGLCMGRALLAQRKLPEAIKAFEGVLAIEAKGPAADSQRLGATLGKARCLAESGKPDEAIKVVEEIIAAGDAEQVELQAQAYNALGTMLKSAGRTKEALMAFLHVDLLYSSAAEAHAEALANLAELWSSLKQTERAVQARRTLEERYKNSPWARR